MKRRIVVQSATNTRVAASELHPAFSELENYAYNRHYELTGEVDNSGNYQLHLECTKNPELMPVVTITTDNSSQIFTFATKLTFPELDSSQLDYADSIAHWTSRWAVVGELCTQICRFRLDPTEWEE